MDKLSYETLRNQQPGTLIQCDQGSYHFLCRQTLPDGEFCLLEQFAGEQTSLVILREKETRVVEKFLREKRNTEKKAPLSVDRLFDAGQDLAAQELNVKPLCLPDVKGLLPALHDHAFFPIGHPASDACVSVDRLGNIWGETNFLNWQNIHGEQIIYDPRIHSGSSAALAKPRQRYLDGILPVVINEHRSDTEILESMYLMEVGDVRLGPAVWIRNVRISMPDRKIKSIEYRGVGTDPDNRIDDCGVLEERFYDCLAGLIYSYDAFLQQGAGIEIPDKQLQRSYYGTQFTITCLFNGPQARYGHRFYRFANHNFFPPNYITSILAFTLSNQLNYVGMLVDYLLGVATDPFGRLLYRQGRNHQHGFSASELGQLLWAMSRYHMAAGASSHVTAYMDRVCAMGKFICSRILPCQTVPETFVVRTCAEADTNERIADYVQNIAWSIRGLDAIVRMLGNDRNQAAFFAEKAELLRDSFRKICKECAIETPFGDLIPFNLQYPVLPLTMSNCRDTTVPVDADTLEDYLAQKPARSFNRSGMEQDLMENRYSNYRYYPELLSACLLTPEQEAPIVHLRENYGGEILGMIRFQRWLDDWPAYNLAINYMERGRIDKFLLLLSAHAQYHGLPDYHIYYEQVAFREDYSFVEADSCTPSILLNNIMLNFMFCYETVNSDSVHLLKGIPADWLGKRSFSAHDLRCSYGTVNIQATPKRIRIELNGNFPETRLYLNGQESFANLPKGVRSEGGYLVIPGKIQKLTVHL